MTEKVLEPFGFVLEPDGSVGIDAPPTNGEESWHHVGHLRVADDGTIIPSITYEEPQNYGDWKVHKDVDEAVLSLMKNCIESIDGVDVEEYDLDRLASLRRSETLVKQYSHRVTAALAVSARYAVVTAVKNMLRLSTHDEVTKTVSEALVCSVMEE